MMSTWSSSKTQAVVTTALLVASLFWLLNTKRVNRSLEGGLNNERLRSEALLSEKLLLEKDLDKFKNQLFALKDKNDALNNVVQATEARLKARESEYDRMKRQNLSLQQVKKQREELIALQKDLERQLEDMKLSYTTLQAQHQELNNTVALLQERNRLLNDELNKAMLAAIDQSQLQAVKGKHERLTVSARRTKKLIANFEVPAGLRNLSFRVVDPQGRPLDADEGTIASNVLNTDENYVASTDGSGTSAKPQKVQVVYIPKRKLKAGVYRVEILSENLYAGSLNVKLR
ncbi:hypothetical protein KK083_06065 [Fulvivirgaceae bacterium PWU4]|uniref:Uncharacterized protein n=1 Tax=Chryseosolibacter histidini TaxID=2782349 RepID=A0AAP2DHL6_9BACT|nr:hypothetical protein [Chryseosolibacter histidini]MBT1696431.1 hypothetical protein [Chryseosolibacter histidini]